MIRLAPLVLLVLMGASPQSKLEHPFLFFNAKTLPGFQSKLSRAPFSARWSRFLQTADAYCEAPIAGFDKVRDAQGICGATAFAYAMTGQKKYAERAKKEALALLSAPAWHVRKDWNKGAELGTAEASQACALVYDWCFGTITPAERKIFRDGLLAKSTKVYLQSIEEFKDWWVDNPVTNWCGVVHGGCGLAALALADEGPEFRKAAEAARKHVPEFLRDVNLEDGGGYEGIMYHRYGVVFGHIFHAADLNVTGARSTVYGEDAKKLAGYWDVYMQGPDLRYANFGDMGEETFEGYNGQDPRKYEGGPSGELCALFESQVPGGDPLLLWGADNGGGAFFYHGVSPFWFLWRREVPPAGKRPDLQDAVLFRGSGHAVMQSPALWLAFNAGWTSDKSHANLDLGTFVLVAGGERFVCDPGYGKIETSDHSTLLANGKSQPKDVRAAWIRFGSGRNFHYAAADITDAVKTELKRWIRHVLVVRGAYVVILDDVSGDADVEWRLQTRMKVQRAPDGRSAQIVGGKSALSVIAAAPPDAQIAEGKGDVTYLQGKAKARRPAVTFVTVLHPGPAPAVTWDGKGVLKVGGDTITFKATDGGWILGSVGDESAAKLGTGKDRSLVPFRNK